LRTLQRHIDFDRIPVLAETSELMMVVGTVNVNTGTFETFTDGEITIKSILASTAVPRLSRSVEIDGDYYWDGILSQNPPVYDLIERNPALKPDELWVVQINPQEFEGEPRRVAEIVDRRSELAGNLSLNQELGFIETVNEWVEQGYLPDDEYRQINIRRLMLAEQLESTSRFDRSQDPVGRLIASGIDVAETFIEELEVGDQETEAVMATDVVPPSVSAEQSSE